jgi:ribulose-phosphate 3-epimerase
VLFRSQADGGISADTIRNAALAGVNCFVAGSAVFGAPNTAAAIAQLHTAASNVYI